MSVTESCQTCRNWRRTDGERGECHAETPRPFLDVDTGDALALVVVWPPMPAGGWCAGWRAMPVRQVYQSEGKP